MKPAVWLLLTVSLAGCASAGTQVTEDQAKTFQPGRSTYAEVVASLGQPTTVSLSSATGQKIAIYSYSSTSARPQNFIPYIGPLVGGYDTRSSAVTFTFDARDVLVSFNSAQTGLGAGANLAATPPRN